jgi:hypothetical protein
MQKLRNPNNPARVAAASVKAPLEEEMPSARARKLVVSHCECILEHMRDEKQDMGDAIMSGRHTRYGEWWHSARDPAKRPFYKNEPEEVASAINELDAMDAVEIADQLRYIARRSVVEYQPAAEAAKKKLAEISMRIA